MTSLSPKLKERKRQREARARPWKETSPISPAQTREFARLSLASSSSTPTKKPTKQSYGRKFCTVPTTIGNHSRFEFRRVGPFPFQRLPYDIQVMVGEHVVQQYRAPMKCADFVPHNKDGKPTEQKRHIPPRHPLSATGQPTWIPLLQICPWLSRDLTRTWYNHTTFLAKTVEEWKIFIKLARRENVDRIRELQVDNELIYGTGKEVGESEDWRSHVLLSPMKRLETLTLYRDDGGPGTYTHGGNDDFNSVDWFVKFAENCKTVQHIKFALYPWSGFDKYNLKDSNMVVWVKEWEHKWESVLQKRRKAGEKSPQSCYLTNPPRIVKPLANGSSR